MREPIRQRNFILCLSNSLSINEIRGFTTNKNTFMCVLFLTMQCMYNYLLRGIEDAGVIPVLEGGPDSTRGNREHYPKIQALK